MLTNNYQPINFAFIFCKILEPIIHDSVATYFHKNGLIHNVQPCLMNLLMTMNNFIKRFDGVEEVNLCFSEFSKPLDVGKLEKGHAAATRRISGLN